MSDSSMIVSMKAIIGNILMDAYRETYDKPDGDAFQKDCFACAKKAPEGMSGLLEGWTYDPINCRAVCNECLSGYDAQTARYTTVNLVNRFRLEMAFDIDRFRDKIFMPSHFMDEVRRDIQSMEEDRKRKFEEEKRIAIDKDPKNVARRAKAIMNNL